MIDIEFYKDNLDLSDLELDVLYMYLDVHYISMTDEERSMWSDILDKIDPDDKI